jgi:DNA-binding MarR family transcriptional regulator
MFRSKGPLVADMITPERATKCKILPRLFSVTRATRTLMGYKLAKIGIHAGQDELLLALDPEEPRNVTLLADTLNIRIPIVSRMLDRLVASGLVERVKDSRDDRRTVIRITPAGIEMQDRIREVWLGVEDEFKEMPQHGRAQQDLERLGDILTTRLRRLR